MHCTSLECVSPDLHEYKKISFLICLASMWSKLISPGEGAGFPRPRAQELRPYTEISRFPLVPMLPRGNERINHAVLGLIDVGKIGDVIGVCTQERGHERISLMHYYAFP